jgi:two-component system CheB/CheR fusion protein
VGIGASAGGIEALEALFASLPTQDFQAAYIVVTQLAPHRESLLREIIARHTSLPVEPVHNGASIESGRFYVLPAHAVLTIDG